MSQIDTKKEAFSTSNLPQAPSPICELLEGENGYLLDFEKAIEKAEIGTKFGGFPDWIDSPQWPIHKPSAEEYRFICQVKIDSKLFPQCKAKMAYFFLWDREPSTSSVQEGVVILQPGMNNHVDHEPKTHGATLVEMVSKKGFKIKQFPKVYRQAPVLTAITQQKIDDALATNEPLNKVGGAADSICSTSLPDETSEWSLLFQLNKNTLPFDLDIADNGICYGFINKEGSQCRIEIQGR